MTGRRPGTGRIVAAVLVIISLMSILAESPMGATSVQSNQDDQLIIVLLSDVHISQESSMSLLHSLLGQGNVADPLATVSSVVGEIAALHPDMVVVCGDHVLEARTSHPADARAAFQLFNQSMLPLIQAGIPIYPVLGNHDVAGVLNARVNSSEAGYGKGAFLDSFRLSRSYYSFDQGGYHFVVLDPNSYELWNASSGMSRYRIDGEQMHWLYSDLNSTTMPAIVFLHEPTVDLINGEELLDALQGHDVLMIFSGHWHINDLISRDAIDEQVTSALSGSWWTGADLSAEPGGYRIIACNGSKVTSFYRYAGRDRQINIVEPQQASVNGSLDLRAQIWSGSTVRSARVSLDGQSWLEMNLSAGGLWHEAKRMVDLSGLPQGYHRAEITAQDTEGDFSRSLSFRISGEESVPVGEISSHLQTYLGRHLAIRGWVDGYRDLSLVDGGVQPVLRDKTGSIALVLGSCPSLKAEGLTAEESSTTVGNRTLWLVEGQLQRYILADRYSILVLRADGPCPVPCASRTASAIPATFLSYS